MKWKIPGGGNAGSYLGRAETLPAMMRFARKFRTCIQAGGHIGIYPAILAKTFKRVLTLEPELHNFRCLVENVEAPNVYPIRGVLGHKGCGVALRINTKSSGGHSVDLTPPAQPSFAYPVYRIDDFHLDDLDAVFLDIEGYEMHALRGAIQTLRKCAPLVVVEENKKMHYFGRRAGDVQEFLKPLGYKQVARSAEDLVFVCESS